MRHFLSLADFSPAEINGLLDLAVKLKKQWKRGGNAPISPSRSLSGTVSMLTFTPVD